MAEVSEEVGSGDPFEAAVAAMEAELGQASPDDESTALPADFLEDEVADDDVADDAGAGSTDDPDDGEADDFFAEGSEPEEEGVSSQEIADDTLVEVPKYGRVPIGELVKGYMRMDHFTKGTQEVEDLKRQLEEKVNADTTGNSELWQALKEDPQGTVAYLAAEVGLMDRESIKDKMRELEAVKLRPESDVEKMVQERLDAAVRNHPAVQEAISARVTSQIDSQFAAIESRVGRTLTDRDRFKVMDFAAQNGIVNLDVAFDALAARRNTPVAEGDDVRKVRPQKRTPAQRHDEPSFDGTATDFDDAAARAIAELEAAGVV